MAQDETYINADEAAGPGADMPKQAREEVETA